MWFYTTSGCRKSPAFAFALIDLRQALLAKSREFALPAHRLGSRNPVVLIVDGEGGVPSQPNIAAASIGQRKPETAHFRIDLFDFCFFRPERRIFRGSRLNARDREVLGIHPNSAPI